VGIVKIRKDILENQMQKTMGSKMTWTAENNKIDE
jgi:hypothetical protein